MEVQDSVPISDKNEYGQGVLYGGFADLGKPRSEEQRDNVPRILVQNFKKQTKLYTLFCFFDQFGPITYIAMRDQQAVIEFLRKETLRDVLCCKHLTLNGAKLRIYPLTWFPHVEQCGLEFCVSPELQAACETASKGPHEDDSPAEAWLRALISSCRAEAVAGGEVEAQLLKRVQSALSRAFPRSQVHAFGSRTTGLALPSADLDLFVDIGNMYNGEIAQDGNAQRALVNEASKELSRYDHFRCMERVLGARVPILRFCYVSPNSDTQLYSDAAFRNGLGVENSRFLSFLLRLEPRLQPLILLLKQWARWQGLQQQTLSRGPAFTSYGIAMLAIFFLQQPPASALPPLATFIRAYRGPEKRIAGWACGFAEDMSLAGQASGEVHAEASDPVRGAVALAKLFFAFYRSFKFEELAILPLLGRAVSKRALEDALAGRGDNTELIDIYENYRHVIDTDELAEKLNIRAHIVLQDPFEHSHNLTRNVKEDDLMRFISSCALTDKWLSSLL